MLIICFFSFVGSGTNPTMELKEGRLPFEWPIDHLCLHTERPESKGKSNDGLLVPHSRTTLCEMASLSHVSDLKDLRGGRVQYFLHYPPSRMRRKK
jgi:hypothetical protein